MLAGIYRHFSDYVQKNPFYTEGMLIKIDLFEDKVTRLADKFAAHYKAHYKR